MFKLNSTYEPKGDQPQAICLLSHGLEENLRNQVLLGVTGSGKTFTMANVITQIQKPTLIMAPNKTLAAQLYSEMKEFFPENAVEYFVSYYDYYQPEAYIPQTNTYIEKESSINEQIDRMRHSATRALIERRDVIIVASVSCIYGIGGSESYEEMTFYLKVGDDTGIETVQKKLVELLYNRNDINLQRGTFRVCGDILDIFPAHSDERIWRISFFGDEIESIQEIESLTGKHYSSLPSIRVFANSHYVTPRLTRTQAIKEIKKDLSIRLKELEEQGKLIEYQRLKERTEYDIEMILTTGSCNGIENYSRYLSGRKPGEPPPTLFEYFPDNALLIIDESHVAVPQVRGMYAGDRSRKQNLVNFGFRLPSCLDNRPLMFDEWDKMRPNTIFVSATPGPFELALGNVVEQVVRPTGLLDPPCFIRPCTYQVDDLLGECKKTIQKGFRVLVTTLTKKMAEGLCDYFEELGLKVRYMHSDVNTLERIEIIQGLRHGDFDILIGINLLREGLDIPECGLMAILDADKEGFLRSETSLIQTIGRAARNADSYVLLYADIITGSIKRALEETDRRRSKQIEYNKQNGITPKTIIKNVHNTFSDALKPKKKKIHIEETDVKKLKKMMLFEAENMNFERAAAIRDQLQAIIKG